MKSKGIGLCLFLVLVLWIRADDPPLSEASQTCLECHAYLHPGIVEGWKRSRHSRITTKEALQKSGAESLVSSRDISEGLMTVTVGCAECHTLRPEAHRDTFKHNGHRIHVVVSPRDCAVCHEEESRQYEGNLMSRAYGNLMNNSVYRLLIRSILHTPVYESGKLIEKNAGSRTEAESCLYCHGTELKITGTSVRDTDFGEMTFPVIRGWPNGGSGRVNLDGSLGSCSSCHHRHGFSIEAARKPHSCRECHEGPDVPAYKVYRASKHGKIYSSQEHSWNFNAVPWRIGRDFTAPTCAACHMSLLTDADGEVVSRRTHEVKDRLSYRIFGLIYAHPHPRKADTSLIRNGQGLPLPTDFQGNESKSHLLDVTGMEANRRAMQRSCLKCHDRSWVDGHWARLENSIHQTNQSIKASTRIMMDIWKRGLADGLSGNASPFDEYIEKRWIAGWLFFANTIRFASAMAGGGDYAVFAKGRFQLAENLRELADWLKLRRRPRDPSDR